jgi:FeS assembly SUF system protein
MTNPTLSSEATPADTSLRERVEDALRGVYDPEIPVNIYELGLIYELEVSTEGVVEVKMTLTTPNCPAAGAMPGEIETKLRALEGVSDVHVELVWDPPWDKSRMSEAARLELGLL